MITAKEARKKIESIDWVNRTIDNISKEIDNSCLFGYSNIEYSFSSKISKKNVSKIIKQLKENGYSISIKNPENPSWSPYIITW